MMLPLIQTLRLIASPTKFLEDCAAKYGELFTVRVLGINSPPVVFFGSPEAIAECFAVPAKDLDFKKATHVFEPLFGENSIVLQEGRCLLTSRSASVHNRQRQLLMPPFHGAHMKTYGQVICKITEEVTNNWTEGSAVSMQHVMPDITLQIILYRFTLRLIQMGGREQGAGSRGKELETNHLYQGFREMVLQVVFGISPGLRYEKLKN